ncbi:MAG: hypothetical protein R3C28_26945 [Pirellulaceae bacterium]
MSDHKLAVHQLKNSLTAIRQLLYLVRKKSGAQTPDFEKYLDLLEQEVVQCCSLADALDIHQDPGEDNLA